MQRDTVNERSACWLEVSLYDTEGQPLIPVTCTYAVYDVLSGQQILAPTPATPAFNTVLTITPGNNAMVDQTKHNEVRRVTWTFNAGQANESNGELLYNLKNLYRVN